MSGRHTDAMSSTDRLAPRLGGGATHTRAEVASAACPLRCLSYMGRRSVPRRWLGHGSLQNECIPAKLREMAERCQRLTAGLTEARTKPALRHIAVGILLALGLGTLGGCASVPNV